MPVYRQTFAQFILQNKKASGPAILSLELQGLKMGNRMQKLIHLYAKEYAAYILQISFKTRLFKKNVEPSWKCKECNINLAFSFVFVIFSFNTTASF